MQATITSSPPRILTFTSTPPVIGEARSIRLIGPLLPTIILRRGIGDRLVRGGIIIHGPITPGIGILARHGAGDGVRHGAGEAIIPAIGDQPIILTALLGPIVRRAIIVRPIVRVPQPVYDPAAATVAATATPVPAIAPAPHRLLPHHIVPDRAAQLLAQAIAPVAADLRAAVAAAPHPPIVRDRIATPALQAIVAAVRAALQAVASEAARVAEAAPEVRVAAAVDADVIDPTLSLYSSD